MVKAVIFDFDGVLADSHGIINRIFSNILKNELEIEVSEEEFGKLAGMRFEHRIEKIAHNHKLKISKNKALAVAEKGRQEYFINGIAYVRLFPGAERVLNEFKSAGFLLGLGTNGSRQHVELLVKMLNIGNYFSSVVTFSDVAVPKPSPDIFLKCA